MPIVKNVFERLKILDRCFRDERKKYFFEDLFQEVNRYVRNKYNTEISERTLRKDIAYMKDSTGYSAPIVKKMEGHRAYYFYSDSEYSILNLPITNEELSLLTNMVRILSIFKGLPYISMMEETLVKLEDVFGLDNIPKGVILFDNNIELKGIQHFEPLMNAIVEHKVLHVNYIKFHQQPKNREIHPYQLKQYNNRWFLIGMEPRLAKKIPLVCLPLNRIESFTEAKEIVYQTYKGIDIEEYFSQIVGVSLNNKAKKKHIVIKVGYPAADYLISKPLHHSQRIIEENNRYTIIEYNLIPNYEFETQLLGFLDECKILKPISLRNKMRKRAEKIVELNK